MHKGSLAVTFGRQRARNSTSGPANTSVSQHAAACDLVTPEQNIHHLTFSQSPFPKLPTPPTPQTALPFYSSSHKYLPNVCFLWVGLKFVLGGYRRFPCKQTLSLLKSCASLLAEHWAKEPGSVAGTSTGDDGVGGKWVQSFAPTSQSLNVALNSGFHSKSKTSSGQFIL